MAFEAGSIVGALAIQEGFRAILIANLQTTLDAIAAAAGPDAPGKHDDP